MEALDTWLSVFRTYILAKPKFASELGAYPATHGERDCRAPVQGGGARQGVSCTATATGHTEGQSPGM